MNKSPVLALVSLFFVASVVSFPLNEPTLSGLTSNSVMNQNLVDAEDIEDGSMNYEDNSLSDDLGTDNNEKIEKYVLGQPMPKRVTSGACYQQCKKTTPARCTKAVHNDVKKFTKGELNYCSFECGVVNTNCFKRS